MPDANGNHKPQRPNIRAAFTPRQLHRALYMELPRPQIHRVAEETEAQRLGNMSEHQAELTAMETSATRSEDSNGGPDG